MKTHARVAFASIIASTIFAGTASAQMMAQVWNQQCASCHDASGGGVAPVKTLLESALSYQDTDRRFFDSIKSGMKDVKDHAFGEGSPANLDNTKVWGLVNHLRELQARALRKQVKQMKPDGNGLCKTSLLTYKAETVVKDGLDTPWSVEFVTTGAMKGMMLITERAGTIKMRRLDSDTSKLIDIEGLPKVRNNGQGGLMDIALHPLFTTNGWIYLSFADEELKESNGKTNSLGMTKIVRGKIVFDESGARWTEQQTIFEAKREHYLPGGVHFGSKFAFDPNDPTILFFGIGERGHQDMAQDVTRPNGKIHRVKDDGSIPKDNPFFGVKNAYESIWSYGHRNPQGLTFDLEGNLWDTEHAPRGGDELNLVKKGLNYGWPLVSYGINYSGAAFQSPWVETTPKLDPGTKIEMPHLRWMPSIAACGLCVVDAAKFPHWKGDLLAGGLAGNCVDRVRIKDGNVEQERIFEGMGRVRDVVNGPDGAIYIVTNGPDRVVRLVPGEAKPIRNLGVDGK
jgi:glucose/arabinose dehydrogenase